MKCDWCDKPAKYVYAMQYPRGTYSIDLTCVEHRPSAHDLYGGTPLKLRVL